MFGKMYPAREIYPCSEDWGKLAVSVCNLERAMTVAQELSKIAKQDLKGHQKGPCRSRIGQGRAVRGQAGRGEVSLKHKVSEAGSVLEVSSTVLDQLAEPRTFQYKRPGPQEADVPSLRTSLL